MIRAIGSTRSRIRAEMARRALPRWIAGRRPQATCAVLAAATASSTASCEETGISEMTAPLDGLRTGIRSLLPLAIRRPPI